MSNCIPVRQTFIANFLAALDTLTPLVSRQKYAAVVNGTGNTTVYAFGECMRDLSQTDCDLCFAQCKTQILRCLPFQKATRGGRLFFDGCYLRYDDFNFFNQSLSAQDKSVCGSTDFGGDQTVFKANALELVRNLSVEAPKNDGFFVGSVNRGNVTVYGSFYNNNTVTDAGGGNGGHHHLAVILAVQSAAFALMLAVSTIAFLTRKKLLKKRKEKKQLGALLSIVTKSQLNYSYEVLENATNYFHASNKLGQGGSGSVYKGVLSDGKVVAIKSYWDAASQALKSLLVYEFVPNQSLHDYFSGNILFYVIENNLEPLRLFPEDKTHISTAIAGTLGYMAPEYVTRGKLTEKADVYSFGVVVIEIISGKRIKSFASNSVSILQTVWDLYGTGQLCNAVDPVLEGKFKNNEASRLLQIGLLCIQASAELRPSMPLVVKMLTDQNLEMPKPTQPPFLNSGSAEFSRHNIISGTSNSLPESHSQSSRNSMTQSLIEPR
ncbi:hypothetical protein M0R45_021765 [Rubus argutus]|uniref:Cysteine-rich receptor-like protein kinase 3 n=1 Tax=Rubus argutus TaxID=59490 RepID=A0AAW1XC95_RUBAR